MKRGCVCQTQRLFGSTAPGWIGHRVGLGKTALGMALILL